MKNIVSILLLAAVCSTLGACRIQRQSEIDSELVRRKAVADVAATIFEAGTAIEQGVDPAAPAAAIKAGAAAIIRSEGHTYEPAAAPQTKETP